MRDRIFVVLVLVLGLAWAQSAEAQPGDAESGEDVFKVCRACHQVGPGARNGIGPTLNGIVGSKTGTVAGLRVLRGKQTGWDQGLGLDGGHSLQVSRKSRGFMPGNKMTYAGMKDEADRRDLIAYLKQQPGQ
jgi:cytochrome c